MANTDALRTAAKIVGGRDALAVWNIYFKPAHALGGARREHAVKKRLCG